MGEVVRRYAQLALENDAVPGLSTAVAATRKIPLLVDVEPVTEWYVQGGYRGDYEAAYAVAPGARRVNVTLTLDGAMQADLALLLQAVRGGVSPSTVDTSGRIWTFSSSNTSAKKRLTLEFYDGDQAWKITYLVLKTVTLTINAAEVVQAKFTGFGIQQATVTAAALSQIVNVPLMSWQKVLAVDPAGTAAGTTALDATIVSAEYACDNQAKPVNAGNNTPYFKAVSYGPWQQSCSLKCLMSSAALEFSNYDAGTARTTQVEVRGPLITAAYQGIKLNLAGPWQSWKVSEYEGLNAVDLKWQPKYDSTLTYSDQIVVTNLINAY